MRPERETRIKALLHVPELVVGSSRHRNLNRHSKVPQTQSQIRRFQGICSRRASSISAKNPNLCASACNLLLDSLMLRPAPAQIPGLGSAIAGPGASLGYGSPRLPTRKHSNPDSAGAGDTGVSDSSEGGGTSRSGSGLGTRRAGRAFLSLSSGGVSAAKLPGAGRFDLPAGRCIPCSGGGNNSIARGGSRWVKLPSGSETARLKSLSALSTRQMATALLHALQVSRLKEREATLQHSGVGVSDLKHGCGCGDGREPRSRLCRVFLQLPQFVMGQDEAEAVFARAAMRIFAIEGVMK